eukprot:CAMPEP_0170256766 /NCGR_PEP_ID=MMETSP0116_2-20130129/28238_1 /TAXON_ID=400756 /ORGANISM="Durinskia baltica, Strain CSIRO CS-38" /LENGTH=167 /DNA_ID=CAMNT_0010507779 /DNA_START=319 /DNA_END=818 /DNA_ORIENTATION=+
MTVARRCRLESATRQKAAPTGKASTWMSLGSTCKPMARASRRTASFDTLWGIRIFRCRWKSSTYGNKSGFASTKMGSSLLRSSAKVFSNESGNKDNVGSFKTLNVRPATSNVTVSFEGGFPEVDGLSHVEPSSSSTVCSGTGDVSCVAPSDIRARAGRALPQRLGGG